MKQYIPLMIEISKKNILLIGGGKAAAEKLRTLSQLQKKITAISPEFVEEFHGLKWIDFQYRKYKFGDLDNFDLVYVGINDPKIEKEILVEAREKRILINFIDKVEDSDFISVAGFIKKNFSIFISTYGKGPGASKKIRQEIEAKLNLEQIDIEVGEYIKQREEKKRKENSIETQILNFFRGIIQKIFSKT
jgi:precorrin-2 dehydrogenase / sirohydrochlorin ferrochelatase